MICITRKAHLAQPSAAAQRSAVQSRAVPCPAAVDRAAINWWPYGAEGSSHIICRGERMAAVRCCAVLCRAVPGCASSFFRTKINMYVQHAAFGLFFWSMEFLAFAIRLFAPKILDHLSA